MSVTANTVWLSPLTTDVRVNLAGGMPAVAD